MSSSVSRAREAEFALPRTRYQISNRAVGPTVRSTASEALAMGTRYVLAFTQLDYVKGGAHDHNGLTHSDTEARASSEPAGGPIAPYSSSHRAPAGAEPCSTTAWSDDAVHGPLRQRDERSGRRPSLPHSGSNDTSASQAVQQSRQPRCRAAGLRLGPVPAARAGRGTLGARGPNLGSPVVVNRPRMAPARGHGRTPT